MTGTACGVAERVQYERPHVIETRSGDGGPVSEDRSIEDGSAFEDGAGDGEEAIGD
jgi:hypothetical protein